MPVQVKGKGDPLWKRLRTTEVAGCKGFLDCLVVKTLHFQCRGFVFKP